MRLPTVAAVLSRTMYVRTLCSETGPGFTHLGRPGPVELCSWELLLRGDFAGRGVWVLHLPNFVVILLRDQVDSGIGFVGEFVRQWTAPATVPVEWRHRENGVS